MKKLSLSIFISTIVLMSMGLIILMSASSLYSQVTRDNQFAIFYGQLIKGSMGIGLMILFSLIPYQVYKDFSKYLIVFIVIILFITLFFMPEVNHVHRWFTVSFISFQPAEFAKLFLFIHLAKVLSDKEDVIRDFKQGLMLPIISILIITGLIFFQPGISNATVLFLTGFILLFIAGARVKHLFVSIVSVGIPAVMMMFVFPHSRKRLFSFIGGYLEDKGYNFQTLQGLIGLGSGGFLGLGFGNSNQRNLFLPEAYGDFIFAIVGEETGFIGAVLVLCMFLAVFVIGIIIAKKTEDRFGQLLATAISISFVLHALIHIAVVSGITPTTGLPLPFISHGGTSLLMLCISMGILMNIGFSGVSQATEVVPDGVSR